MSLVSRAPTAFEFDQRSAADTRVATHAAGNPEVARSVERHGGADFHRHRAPGERAIRIEHDRSAGRHAGHPFVRGRHEERTAVGCDCDAPLQRARNVVAAKRMRAGGERGRDDRAGTMHDDPVERLSEQDLERRSTRPCEEAAGGEVARGHGRAAGRSCQITKTGRSEASRHRRRVKRRECPIRRRDAPHRAPGTAHRALHGRSAAEGPSDVDIGGLGNDLPVIRAAEWTTDAGQQHRP